MKLLGTSVGKTASVTFELGFVAESENPAAVSDKP
jgi:hypothetical protein